MEAVFVHGALVRDGDWWWHRAADLLREETGTASRSVRLPSTGETHRDDGSEGLVADARALREALDDLTDTAVVVGHSYGGTVIAEAGAHPAVERLVLISSYLPPAGTSQGDVMADEPDPARVEPSGDGLVRLAGYDVDGFTARFLHDLRADLRADAWARVVPQSVGAFTTPTSAAGWEDVDSTYLVCLDDRSTSVALQRRHAERATRAVELPTGHHPFLSRPDLVVPHLLPAR